MAQQNAPTKEYREMFKKLSIPLALVVAAAFAASPAIAQEGHGHGHGRDHDRQEQNGRRDDGDDDDQGNYNRYQNQGNYRLERRVPPGWCTGRGNPHNTVQNCGYNRSHQYYDRRYDPRYNGGYNNGGYYGQSGNYGTYGNDPYGTNPNYGYGTYPYGTNNRQAYDQWRQWHNQQCQAAARQHPLDLRWQSQVRAQCQAEDRAARQRYGIG
jgi:hypothetical protein